MLNDPNFWNGVTAGVWVGIAFYWAGRGIGKIIAWWSFRRSPVPTFTRVVLTMPGEKGPQDAIQVLRDAADIVELAEREGGNRE